MSFRCVVLDFDGTLTDIAREAVSFQALYPRHLADLLGEDLTEEWREIEGKIQEEAPERAWRMAGHDIAPADADPYIVASEVARSVFDRRGLLKLPKVRDAISYALYGSAYADDQPTAWREDTRDVLAALVRSDLHVRVITNSTESKVKNKLATLGFTPGERFDVIGDARKFAVGAPSQADARFDAVPETVLVEGLSRPVYPRRGAYFDRLKKAWESAGCTPEEVMVCGDIYELDLVLPAALGMGVHALSRPRTHAYERAAVAALGERGGGGDRLGDLLGRVL